MAPSIIKSYVHLQAVTADPDSAPDPEPTSSDIAQIWKIVQKSNCNDKKQY
jgi:hypothetical protein